MNLFTFSGPCGSGKSTLAYILEEKFERVKTSYKNCNGANLCPNSYKSKIDYTIKWFEEIKVQYYKGTEVLISDRSPFDCLAYLKENQKRYEYEVLQQFEELNRVGVDLKEILITAEKNILESRIFKRAREQSILGKEITDLEFSLEFYNSRLEQFDLIIDTSYSTPTEIKNKVFRNIMARMSSR